MFKAAKPVPILLWIFGVGFAGFMAGFVGPLILNTGANQGPLVGIFISGPASFALGLILCVVCRLLRIAATTQWRTFWISCAIVAAVTLVAVMPGPLRGAR
jgi:hypothetical protein